MRFLILIVTLFSFHIDFSQKIYSVYFSASQPQKVKAKVFFDTDIIGVYKKQDNELVDIVIDSTEIVVRYIVPMFLTATEINSNDKFEIKNNMIFGVDENKGLEYFVDNDTLYFGVFQKDLLFSITDSTILKKEGDNYFLNSKVNDFWETTLLYKKDKTLYLRTIDVSEEEDKIKKNLSPLRTEIFKKEKIFVSSTSFKGFDSFVKEKGFYDIVKYVSD